MDTVYQDSENDCESPGTRNVAFTHECFFPEEGFELEGSLSKRICKKNPGHEAFIPIKDLRRGHLPSNWEADTMLEYIKAIAALTVRIRAGKISHKRPKSLLLDRKIKPGASVCYYGTGFVYRLPESLSPCPCTDCGNRPGTTGYEIHLKTAAHVIYDSEEASKSRIEFYADDSQPNSSNMTLPGWRVWETYLERDSCRFSCLTHDENIFSKLQNEFKTASESFQDIKKILHGDCFPYFFIISHPHGYSKHISFGSQFEYVDIVNGAFFKYNTPTCPGSSGAYISDGFVWPRSAMPILDELYGPHHGVNHLDSTTNRSGFCVLDFFSCPIPAKIM